MLLAAFDAAVNDTGAVVTGYREGLGSDLALASKAPGVSASDLRARIATDIHHSLAPSNARWTPLGGSGESPDGV